MQDEDQYPRTTTLAEEAVGRRCPRLRSVAFVYHGDHSDGDDPHGDGDGGAAWWSQTDSQVVAALVNVAGAAELSSVSFVGFQSVCDIEVTYLADCYTATLRRVDLSGCRSLTDASLAALSERCVGRLRELAFAATRVTDAGVMALVAGCPRIVAGLVALVAGCPWLVAGVAALVAGCPRLVAGCPRLQRVDLADCAALSDAAVRSLASSCPRLERVTLRRCRPLAGTSLDAVAAHRKTVR